MTDRESHRYDDIIDLPHPVSPAHPGIAPNERAAQFGSFAALTGYDDAIRETGRLTQCRMELTEDGLAELDRACRYLCRHLAEQPAVTVTWFVPDGQKSGGRYATHTGRVKRIDEHLRVMTLADGTEIDMDELSGLQVDIPGELT